MRFTADDAFEFRHTADAIMLSRKDVDRILAGHSATIGDIDADEPGLMDCYLADAVDAGDLLAFLGY